MIAELGRRGMLCLCQAHQQLPLQEVDGLIEEFPIANQTHEHAAALDQKTHAAVGLEVVHGVVRLAHICSDISC